LKQKLNHIWRLFGTALSFFLFGLGGLLMGLLLFPALFLFIKDPTRRQTFARACLGRAFSLFIAIMKNLGVLSYSIRGLENLPVPANCIIVANHPTLIDVVFLISLFPEADCVIKSNLWRNPFTRFVVSAANHIPNDDGAGLLQTSTERLRSGGTLNLFPEGTRSTPGRELRFKPGAAAIALRAGAKLLPVLISCRPMTLTRGESWYHIPEHKPFFEFDIFAVMDPSDLVGTSMKPREKEKALNRAMQQFFREHVQD
jgi:1-acyl-sn-glycerol-3-phosphate acyltransferase